MFTGYLITFYISSNFWVNLIDFFHREFLSSGVLMGYYHDEFTNSSFSYKLHQLAYCALYALVCSELLLPRHVEY